MRLALRGSSLHLARAIFDTYRDMDPGPDSVGAVLRDYRALRKLGWSCSRAMQTACRDWSA